MSILEQEIDGGAVAVGLSCSSPEWLKDVIPKVGLRLKVHGSLLALSSHCQASYYCIGVILGIGD